MAARRDMRWLEVRHQAYYAVKDVPRPLREAIGKKRLVKSLQTRDHGLALARRHAALAEFEAVFQAARSGNAVSALIDEGLEWRHTLTAIERGDKAIIQSFRYAGESPLVDPSDPYAPPPSAQENARDVAKSALYERLDALRFEQDRPDDAAMLGNIAFGHVTPLLLHVDDWIREGGPKGPVTARTASQYRRDLAVFVDWLERERSPVMVESVTPQLAARYVTAQLSDGRHRRTLNRSLGAMSSYWRYLTKRHITAFNPWQGQAVPIHRKPGEAASKRPYTDSELLKLLTGSASDELHDLIRIGALSGMRLEEIYRLTVEDCAGGWFNIRESKTHAGIRRVPIHPALTEIVVKRTSQKDPAAFLFHEAGGMPKPGRERSSAASLRFARYRASLGLTDKPDGARQSRIDFHSHRRWFIDTVRKAGIDQTTVAAVVGHVANNITDRVYSAGPSDSQRIACVAAARLPSLP